jgi:hypothetical protein
MTKLKEPYRGGTGSTAGMFAMRDSRHAFGGQRFYAGRERHDKRWYLVFCLILVVAAKVLL